jgi:DNA-binding transcriptional MerR regulator
MSKTTRAFRTIGEASDELGLQPHVLRFWESKFPQIQPMKRGGGRRFYRPEDIEFIRGIKKLLHDEKHPIKDVQSLIKRNGANSVVELGRSVERASRDRAVRDVDLVPDRILNSDAPTPVARVAVPQPVAAAPTPMPTPAPAPVAAEPAGVSSSLMKSVSFEPEVDREGLRDAMSKIEAMRARLAALKAKGSDA